GRCRPLEPSCFLLLPTAVSAARVTLPSTRIPAPPNTIEVECSIVKVGSDGRTSPVTQPSSRVHRADASAPNVHRTIPLGRPTSAEEQGRKGQAPQAFVRIRHYDRRSWPEGNEECE